MTQRATLFAMLFLATTSCSPAEIPPVSPQPTPPATAPTPIAEEQPSSVYYRLVQAGPVDLVVEEVRLDATSSRCFQAQRRVFGGFAFEPGQDDTQREDFSSEVEAVVGSFKEWNKKGSSPTLVLHGHADHEEVDNEDAARTLSQKRAEAIKSRLVKAGVPADRLKIVAHGWALSPAPIVPNDALKPNRRVEVSADDNPPSRAKLLDGKAVDGAVLKALQERVRALEGKSSAPTVSLHAPRIVLVVNDGSGKVELAFDVTSADSEALALHRYFMRGLSNGCEFGAP